MKTCSSDEQIEEGRHSFLWIFTFVPRLKVRLKGFVPVCFKLRNINKPFFGTHLVAPLNQNSPK